MLYDHLVAARRNKMADTPKSYVVNPSAPIARNWEKPLGPLNQVEQVL